LEKPQATTPGQTNNNNGQNQEPALIDSRKASQISVASQEKKEEEKFIP